MVVFVLGGAEGGNPDRLDLAHSPTGAGTRPTVPSGPSRSQTGSASGFCANNGRPEKMYMQV